MCYINVLLTYFTGHGMHSTGSRHRWAAIRTIRLDYKSQFIENS